MFYKTSATTRKGWPIVPSPKNPTQGLSHLVEVLLKGIYCSAYYNLHKNGWNV